MHHSFSSGPRFLASVLYPCLVFLLQVGTDQIVVALVVAEPLPLEDSAAVAGVTAVDLAALLAEAMDGEHFVILVLHLFCSGGGLPGLEPWTGSLSVPQREGAAVFPTSTLYAHIVGLFGREACLLYPALIARLVAER